MANVRDSRLHVHIRRMTLADIDQVVMLDRLSFPIAWSARTYQHEITHNETSMMIVVQEPNAEPANKGNGSEPAGWLPRLLMPVRRYVPLLGYAGFWTIADEAHISTIAVHPSWRGHKLGELQIWIMLQEALAKKVKIVTLEVRVSNQVALNLYKKYGFTVVGQRKGYYRDNDEDAHIMALTPLNESLRAQLERFRRILSQTLVIDVDPLTRRT